MPLYYPPSQNAIQKTLSSSLSTGVTASATLNNVTGIQNKPGVMVVDRINSSGTTTDNKREYITYTGTSGSTVTGLSRGLAGSTDQNHEVGAVVEFIPDILWAQAIVDALANLVDISTLSVDTTKIVTPTSASFTTNDVNLATNLNVKVNSVDPIRGFYIPAAALYSATTNGAAGGQIETTTNKVNHKTWDFDSSSDEYVHLSIPSPHWWDASAVTLQFIWTADSGSGVVVWGCQGVSTSDNDVLDEPYGTAQTVSDTLLATNDDHHTSFTSAITIAGSPVAGDLINLRIYRDADNVSDTLGADARLIGVKVRFTMAQYNDA